METIDGRQLSTQALRDVYETIVILGRPSYITDIARRSGWSAPTVSAALAELVAQGKVSSAHVGKIVKYSPVVAEGKRGVFELNIVQLSELEIAVDRKVPAEELRTLARAFLMDTKRLQ